KSSNPYSSGSFDAPELPDNSNLWTTKTYDSLNRATRVTTPDAAQINTAYNGNVVMVTDQAGKQLSSITDALIRLIQVKEAPNATGYNYQTNYSYDVLGNLIRVRQGGFPTAGDKDQTVQFRTFYYDSLSRLVYASNPEQTATISFTPPGQAPALWTMK